MDYTVGSLADLITGANTPNKAKVVVKKFSPVRTQESFNEEPPLNKDLGEDDSIQVTKKKKKKELSDQTTTPENKSKKRKHEGNNSTNENQTKKLKSVDGTPSTKKTKNEINAERRVKNKEKEQNKVEDTAEQKERTIFVNNIPVNAKVKSIKSFFSKYGTVESVRIRGVPVADPKTPKKVAFIRKEFHPERKTFHAYIRFKTKEEAHKALEANGSTFLDNHLVVDMSVNKERHDESKAIFVGNLSFNAEVDDLWKIFEPCGPINNIRIVRDPRTGMGKGFAYVNFQTSDSVQLALSMENVQLNNRELRISFCNIKAAHKNKRKDVGKKVKRAGKPKKKLRKNKPEGSQEESTEKATVPIAQFKGSEFKEKKKKKKVLKDKKKMIKLVAPRNKENVQNKD